MIYTCIDDLRKHYKSRVPKMFYDYTDTGSWTQSTYQNNQSQFQNIKFRQRVGIDISNRSTETFMLGNKVSMPVALSPIGMTGMQWGDGEILAAKAAEEFGVPYCLSTMSICSIEDLKNHTRNPFWFQLYVMKDRGFAKSLIQRAKDSNCSALVLTLDLQLLGQRNCDLKNGLTAPPRLTFKNILNFASKPQWCWSMLNTRRHVFGNILGHAPGVTDLTTLYAWANTQYDSKLTWNDIEWIKNQWGGKIILKGILDPVDADIACSLDVDALIVSNHGGRQLDGAATTIEVLPSIVDAVHGRSEVWLDSGIRSGQDVLKALALGANSTMIGRSYIYGLGADGQNGVSKALSLIKNELDLTMGFCGIKNISEITKDILYKG